MNEWIKTSDQLPEFNKDILFVAKKPDGVRVGRFYKASNKFISTGDVFFYKFDVTHWMPLPKPPGIK